LFHWRSRSRRSLCHYLCAFLRPVAPLIGSSEITLSQLLKTDYASLIGVHAALGLPYFISWRGEGRELHFLDRLTPELNEKVGGAKIGDWKQAVNWRAFLSEKWSGAEMREITVSADKKVEEDSNE